jgi:hypothetical protein
VSIHAIMKAYSKAAELLRSNLETQMASLYQNGLILAQVFD